MMPRAPGQSRDEMLFHLQSSLLKTHQLYQEGKIPHRAYMKIVRKNEEILKILWHLTGKQPGAQPGVPAPAPAAPRPAQPSPRPIVTPFPAAPARPPANPVRSAAPPTPQKPANQNPPKR